MAQKSCSRCGARANHFVVPYWENDGICPDCCFELNRQYDTEGWPKGRVTEGAEHGPDDKVYVVGLPGARPIPMPVSTVLAHRFPKGSDNDEEPF